MSLINEALKKAHVEARSRAAAEGHVRYPYAPLHGGTAARRGGGPRAAMVAGGIALALAVALLAVAGMGRGGGEASAVEAAAPGAVDAAEPKADASPEGSDSAEEPAASAPQEPPPQEPRPHNPQPEVSLPAANSPQPAPRAAPAEKEPRAARGDRLVLQGVFWSERFAQAIIDGRTVREGDRVGDYEVIEIVPRGVVLEGEAGVVRLTM